MENPLWERILIDWVNCLKLSNAVQKLDDLRDGLFFNNLYKVIKKSSDIDCDVLTCIFDILSEHYTEFMIPNKSVIHLNDLPKDDLCAITSLLMHYTCIHDRREVLTSPLCYNLQENTQIQIKKFLERIQNCTKLTNADLASIIQNCVDDTSCANWISSSVNIPCVSPLHDVLQTPIKSSRLFERDKEINRLKAQIEIFQEEKESLEKDLKSQVEKSKKLEKQLSQKILEISNLRSEVLELEDRTPPHYRDKDFREMQKILRTKVDSLEQILEQSDKENLELREERDKGKAEVIQLEGRCKVWLEKFIDTEKNLQSMTENYKEQLTKNENLQAHCLELETLLEELRPKSNNDSFIEESFQNSSCRSRGYDIQCEDLAQSVVDVQLKEIQKENDTLKIDLRELKNTCIQLKDEINKHVLEKSILSEEKRQLETELQEANGKIEEFMLNYEQLFNQWKSITQERNVLSNEIEILQTSLEKVKEESVKLSEELIESKKDKDKYIKVQIDLGEKLDETIQSNVNLAIDLEKIMLDKCKLSDELNVLVNKNKNLELTCSNMESENNKLIKNVSIGEALNNELKIKNEQLSEQMQSLSAVNDNIREKLKATADNMMISENSLKNALNEKNLVEDDLKHTTLKLEETISQNAQYLQQLTILNNKKTSLEQQLFDLEDHFDDTLDKYESMQNKLKTTTRDKEDLEQNLNIMEMQIENLRKDNSTLTDVFKETCDDKEFLDRKCESLKVALDNKVSDNNLLTKQLEELGEEKIKLVKEITMLHNNIVDQQNSLDAIKSELSILLEELARCKTDKNELTADHEELKRLLKEELHKNEKLKMNLQLTISEKQELTENLQNLISKQENLEMEYNNLQSNNNELNKIVKYNECLISKLEDQFKSLKEQLDIATKENADILNDLRNKTDKMLNFEESLNAVTNEKHTIENDMKDISLELNKANLLNSNYLEQLKFANTKNECLEEKIINLNIEIENLSKKCEELNDNVHEITKEKYSISLEKESLEKDLKNTINEKCILFEQLTNQIRKYEAIELDCKKLIIEKDKTHEDLVVKNILIDEIEAKNHNLTKQLKELCDEKNEIFEKFDTTTKMMSVTEESLKKELLEKQSIQTNLTELNDKLDKQILLNAQYLEELSVANTEKQALENINQSLSSKVQSLIDECKELTLAINETTTKNNDLLNELNNKTKKIEELSVLQNETENHKLQITEHLTECNSTKDKLLMDVNNLREKLKTVTDENENILKENNKNVQLLKKAANDTQLLSEQYTVLESSLKETLCEKNLLNEKLKNVSLKLDQSVKLSAEYLEQLSIANTDRNTLEEKLCNLNNNLQSLSNECEVLNTKVIEITIEKNNILEELENKKKLITDLLNVQSETENYKSKLLDELGEANCHQKKLLTDLNNLEKQLNSKINENEKLAIENTNLTEILNTKVIENTIEKNKILEELENKNKLITDLSNLQSETENYKSKLLDELAEANCHQKKLLTDLNNLEKQLNSKINENEKLAIENTNLTEILNTKIIENNVEKNKILEELENKNKLITDLSNLQSETENYKSKLLDELAEANCDKKKLLTDLNNLEKQLNSKTNENEELVIENRNLTEMLKELATKKQQLDDNLSTHQLILSNINKQNEILKEELRIITQEHSETVSQKDNLYHNHKNVLKSLSEITKDSDKLSQMLMKCEGERDEIATDQISLKEKFTELLSKNDDLGMELKNVSAENCELSEELMSLTSKYKTLECKCENLMTAKQILNETINSMLSENSQISDKLSYITKSFESAMDDFSQENKLLTQKLIQKADVLQNVISEKGIVKGNLELIENQCLLKSKTISDHETALFKQKEVANKLHSSIIEFYQKLVATSNANKILKDTNSQLEEQCKESAKTVNDLSASLKSVIDEKEHLLKEINNIQDKLNIAVNELDTNKIEFNKIYNEWQLSKEQSFNDKQKLKLDVENLILEKTKLEVALQEVLEEKKVISDFLDLNNSELRNTLHEKDRILDALELGNNEMIIMQEEKETLLKEIEKLTLVKNEFSEQLDKVSQENVDISEKLENILKKNHSNTEQVKDLLEKVEQLTEENTQLLGRFTTLSNDLEEKSATIEYLQASCNTLKMEVKEKSELLEKISEEHKDIFDIVDRLSQEKNEMKHTIDTLSEEKMQLIKNVTDLIEEKNKLIECLDLTDKELHKVKKDRDDISERYTKLIKENESNLLFAHQSAVGVKNELLKRIETAETEKEIIRTQMEHDTKNIQDSYVSVVQANSKLELEIINLRKKLEDKNQMKNEYVQIEEAYEKLLEENNRLSTDIDTIRYKRSRDRDEFVRLLKKEREEGITRENKKVKEVRLEYERKLEKMKEKMLKLYSDEVGKEIMKVKAQQSDSMCPVKTKEDFRNGLFETQQKPHMLEIEQDMLRINENHSSKSMYTSRESLRSIKDSHNSIRGSVTSLRSIGNNGQSRVDTMQAMKKVKSTSVLRNDNKEYARKTVTLPRAMTQIQETVTISRRTSLTNVPNIEMEDEDDDFNNKYLADLKAGHCILGDNGRESVRFSELAWRNSMLPPHLKSSYPAETQFVSPSKFREDDLKGGNVELDDSLSKLLPGEKPRQKKDFGTTTYKKPGPPTPSKNGGRLSLQGNEVQPLPLREQNDRTPKKLTPSRIRALFMGRSNIKDNSENQPVTPRTKQRLSIFRKQR